MSANVSSFGRSVESMAYLLSTVPAAERVARVDDVLRAPMSENEERARRELHDRALLVTALRMSVSDAEFGS
jgi:hypothetical protein